MRGTIAPLAVAADGSGVVTCHLGVQNTSYSPGLTVAWADPGTQPSRFTFTSSLALRPGPFLVTVV
ncbi:hypothetical protein [Streptomyces sp. NRRL F-5123]|uniref:hypothetical protein n=1 Tax=Streptomyces sp. NRRL F-5123 TaxID=1463856 RepID=UPI00131B1C5D|nr:hypothetical protein [Streptomyces sp. NRRL F-5123]